MILKFPLTIVDNFFDDPYSIIKYANTLNFYKKNYNYPGERTDSLLDIDINFSNFILKKVLSVFFESLVDTSNVYLCFQKESYEENQRMGKAASWIHEDENDLTFIIYLNPDFNSGTNIYKQKNDFLKSPHTINGPLAYYDGTKNKKEMSKLHKEHKKYYDLIMKCNGNFNTILLYPGRCFHSAINTMKKNQTRLMLIGFISNIITEKMPLDRYRYENHN